MQQQDYKRQTIDELASALHLSSESEYVALSESLKSLEQEALIAKNSKHQYDLIRRMNLFVGIIDVKQKGFGFVRVEDDLKDVFVPKTKTNGALPKDKVLVKVSEEASERGLKEGVVVRILKRNLEVIVGNLVMKKDRGIVKSDDPSLDLTVFVHPSDHPGAITDHKVKVRLLKINDDHTATGKITDILGHKNDPGVDITAVAINYNFEIAFSEDTMNEANLAPTVVDPYEANRRRDLRAMSVVTIDGEDAKDLDDAIYVEKRANGNWMLGVYIADVSYYVKEGSFLDETAYRRGTSVYLADRVIPMLPHKLSNGICSLNEGVDRLVMACDMEIDSLGNVVDHQIYEGIIRSKARMTYTAVNKMIEDHDEETISKVGDLYPMFLKMKELADILKQKRIRRGAIDFETSESKIVVDASGSVINILMRERKSSERLIEEFMLLANETVAEHFKWLDLPFIYRVHDDPKEDRLKKVLKIAAALGHRVKGKENKIHPQALQSLLADLKDDPAEKAINTLMLRSMAKAKYSETNIGHYGLASEYYTHFTSPIRRYPDLLVHRLIREFIIHANVAEENVAYFTKKVAATGIQSSEKERDAVDCENEVNDMKKAEYMARFIGEEFEGVISSLTNWGIYVELPNTVEGLVHMLDMTDDFYEFDETMMIMVGRRTRRIFKIGDIVKVELLSANKAAREINFRIVGMKKSHKFGGPKKNLSNGKPTVKGRKQPPRKRR